jgi:hypothetical protein
MSRLGSVKYRIYFGDRENACGVVQRIPDERVLSTAIKRVGIVPICVEEATRTCSSRGEAAGRVQQEI